MLSAPVLQIIGKTAIKICKQAQDFRLYDILLLSEIKLPSSFIEHTVNIHIGNTGNIITACIFNGDTYI